MSPAAATRRAGGWLTDRLRRRRRLRRASDRRLAENVAERRRPKRLESSRRLAPRPLVKPAAAAAPVVAAAGLSDFAARWMFGDGVVEGTPFAGGAAADYERPSFLDGPDEPTFQPRPQSPPGAALRSAGAKSVRTK